MKSDLHIRLGSRDGSLAHTHKPVFASILGGNYDVLSLDKYRMASLASSRVPTLSQSGALGGALEHQQARLDAANARRQRRERTARVFARLLNAMNPLASQDKLSADTSHA